MDYDETRAEAATHELIAAVGEGPDREGLRDTSARIVRAWEEILSDLNEDPRDYLRTQFEAGIDKFVLVRDIVFHSVCEHHLLSFYGCAHIGYVPHGGRITDLSRLARVVGGYSRRPQVQERLTTQIVNAIDKVSHPQGVIVVIRAEYMCMPMYGAPRPDSSIVTSALRGVMNNGATRAKMMSLMLGSRR